MLFIELWVNGSKRVQRIHKRDHLPRTVALQGRFMIYIVSREDVTGRCSAPFRIQNCQELKMPVVEYSAAASVEEAVSLLSNSDIPAKVLAGGTDLIIQSAGLSPIKVVDIKNIESMMGATIDSDGLTLGPSMPCAELYARDDVKAMFPGLVAVSHWIDAGSGALQWR